MKKNDQPMPYSKILAIKYLFAPLFLLVGSLPSWSQCTIPGATCTEATPISFPFNSRMNADINGTGEIPFCNGIGFFHNSSWYSFVPTTPFIFIDITAGNCSTVGGNQGVQMGLFSDCDPSTPPIGPLQCDCTFPGETITLGGVVTPGETYYILVDGCSGSTCDLQMVLTTGIVAIPTVNLGIPAAPSTLDPIPTCPGAELTFTVPPVNDADLYSWNFPPGTTIISDECNEVTVEWGPISGEVSVSVINFNTGQTNSSPTFTVPVFQPEYNWQGSYCGSSTNGYLFYGDNLLYGEGVYNILIPGIDCDTLVNLSVINSEPILTLSGSNSQTCENEGMVTVTTTGGVSPFTYAWSNGATSSTIDNLAGGNYTVTVTGGDGCTAEGEITITTVQLGYSWEASFCGSSTDGYLFYGDNQLYEAGSYNIILPGSDCDTIVNLSVTNTQPILTISSSDQICENEGMATVTATGGVPPLTYIWSNGATSPTIDNLISGDYTVTVTSADGCTSEGGTTIAAVEYSWAATYCGSSTNGYLFYGDSLLYQVGSYTIIVSGGNCDTIVNLTVTNTEPILTLSGSSQFCENEGMVTLTTTGGVPPFTYVWSNGATSPTIDNLISGDYTVTVTGADGCTSEGETTISNLEVFDLTVNSTPTDCDESNGTASVTIIGGIPNPAYTWSNGATESLITELSPGFYAVTVTDTETNCQTEGNVEVIEDPDCLDNCPVYTVSDGNITVTGFNTARTKIRLWNTEDGWQQVFECDFDCNDPTVISGLSGEYHLKIDAFDDDYNYLCKIDEDLVISGGPCIDNDEDGICASEDCDDNDPDLPTTPGTACNDNNPDTDNDQIQSDGCTCAGTSTSPPTNDCPTYTVSNGTISVTGFNTERTKIRLWSTEGGWQQVFECNFDCNDPTVISGLSGEYHLKIDAFDDDYNYICKVDEDLVISGGPCIDNDDDGICAFEDCDDNDPDFPLEIGTACDDNDPNTTNDQIQSDGCTCAGTPETTDCATIIMTVDDLTIIGNHPNQIIKVFNADWEFVFQCSGDCPNPVVIDNLSEQVYHIKVDAYDSDWNFICKIREDLIPGSSASLRSDNTDLEISKLTLFPNPTRGAFTLSTKDLNGSGFVKIYNAMGQVIQQRAIKDFRAQNFLNFDLSNHNSGLYYVVVQLPHGELFTERIVVNQQ